MKITEFLAPEAIISSLRSADKESVVKEMVEALAKAGLVKNAAHTVEVLLEREKLGSTGIGQNIAVPTPRAKKPKTWCLESVFPKKALILKPWTETRSTSFLW